MTLSAASTLPASPGASHMLPSPLQCVPIRKKSPMQLLQCSRHLSTRASPRRLCLRHLPALSGASFQLSAPVTLMKPLLTSYVLPAGGHFLSLPFLTLLSDFASVSIYKLVSFYQIRSPHAQPSASNLCLIHLFAEKNDVADDGNTQCAQHRKFTRLMLCSYIPNPSDPCSSSPVSGPR